MRRPLSVGLALALVSLGNLAVAHAQDAPNGSALPPLPPQSSVSSVPPGPPPPPPAPLPYGQSAPDPSAPYPQPPSPPFAPPGRSEPVQFAPESPDLSLLARSGSVPVSQLTRFRRVWYYERGYAAAYAPLCEGPCTLSLAPGEHRLAISKNGGRAVPAEPVYIGGPSALHADYADHSGMRAAGVVVGIAGLTAGIVMFVESVGTRQVCDASGCYAEDKVNGGLVVGGIVTILVSSIVGSVLALQPDRAFITVTPLGLSPTARARESGDALAGAFATPQGAGLTASF